MASIPVIEENHGAGEESGKGFIRVILADTQAIFRAGLRKIFALEDDIRVVGQAETQAQALSAVKKFSADVLIFESALAPNPVIGRGPTPQMVADLCRRWRVGADKIHGFLSRGELVGVNVATNLSGRPQWRITQESVDLFERRRSSAPPPKPARGNKRMQTVDYYP